jgi:hypothetical protein
MLIGGPKPVVSLPGWCVTIVRGLSPGWAACVELKILRGFFDVVGPVLVTKTNQPFPVFRDAAYLFGKTRVRISSTT